MREGGGQMHSPMATPPRNASLLPRRLNTASGKFWIEKSVSASCAESTQLRSAGCWISLSVVIPAAVPRRDQATVVLHAACFGARLVLAHSSSLSHLTSSSLAIIAGVPVFAGNSRRWPFGSKK
jgi:hypothetical protein